MTISVRATYTESWSIPIDLDNQTVWENTDWPSVETVLEHFSMTEPPATDDGDFDDDAFEVLRDQFLEAAPTPPFSSFSRAEQDTLLRVAEDVADATQDFDCHFSGSWEIEARGPSTPSRP